jgi:hypothetical protein
MSIYIYPLLYGCEEGQSTVEHLLRESTARDTPQERAPERESKPIVRTRGVESPALAVVGTSPQRIQPGRRVRGRLGERPEIATQRRRVPGYSAMRFYPR